MNVLLDENLSPRLVQLLAAKGIAAQHVAYVGLSGASDPEVWRYAYDHDEVVVTINASDFLMLAASVDLHPGLIVLRSSGLTRDEQWQWVEPVLDSLIASGGDLMNEVIEITRPGIYTKREIGRQKR